MTEESTVATLRRAMNAHTAGHHLPPGLADTVWVQAHAARRRRIRTALAVAATVIVVAGGSTALTLARGADRAGAPAGSSACAGNVSTGTLPAWARSAAPSGPHVLGTNGDIVAILFGGLRAHQPEGRNNKILWIAKDGRGPLHISAERQDSATTANRTVPLGPSIVDLPSAGCWQLTLTWPGHTDTLALRYR